MSATARVEWDMMGVRIAIQHIGDGVRQVLLWERPIVRQYDPEAPTDTITDDENVWLRLDESDARAMYEALADYFGHSGHDMRALRKDYDAERARVDRLILRLAEKPQIVTMGGDR